MEKAISAFLILALAAGFAVLLSSAASAQADKPGLVSQASICITLCGGSPPEFLIQSYQGTKRCLDYTPELTGSPIFLNDCALSHPVIVEEINAQHDVMLHAGAKVIGIRRSTLPVPPRNASVAITATPPPSAAPPVPAAGEFQLELQDAVPHSIQPWIVFDRNFSLDGDSIILASDRSKVAKVYNARGAIGTPIVVGARNLADNEFWDFVASNRADVDPTSGFIRISTATEFLDHFAPFGSAPNSPVGPGTVIQLVPPPSGIDLSSVDLRTPLQIPAGVTIRGNRRGTSLGPEIFTDSGFAGSLLDVAGSDVRITGVRLRGPNTSRDTAEAAHADSRGIEDAADDTFVRVVIDHNDVSDWVDAAVQIKNFLNSGSPDCDPGDNGDPQLRTSNAHVARNFIHHNLVQNNGYGVNSNAGGFPFIEGNMFLENRHAIASTHSTSHTGYRAWSNLVMPEVEIYSDFGFLFYEHDFDVHGLGDNGFGGRGGDYFDIFQNTFLGTRPFPLLHRNFELRGIPCRRVDFHNNVSLQKKDEALDIKLSNFSLLGGDAPLEEFIRIPQQPPQFERPNPTGLLGVGDFNGDGVADLFLATGAAWYYAPAGNAEWRLLAGGRTDSVTGLLFGDFDGDGRTDVVGKNGNNLMVSWGGISEWEVLNTQAPPIADLAVGHFSNAQRDDLFWADGTNWYISDGGSGPFRFVNTSSFRVKDLRFADFDGDKLTDVFGIVAGNWSYSKSALQGWSALRSAIVNDVSLLTIADFDGDGIADVSFSTPIPDINGGISWRWQWSRNGRDNAVVRHNDTVPLALAAGIGTFNGSAEADVLLWGWLGDNNVLAIVAGAIDTKHRQSRQEMR